MQTIKWSRIKKKMLEWGIQGRSVCERCSNVNLQQGLSSHRPVVRSVQPVFPVLQFIICCLMFFFLLLRRRRQKHTEKRSKRKRKERQKKTSTLKMTMKWLL